MTRNFLEDTLTVSRNLVIWNDGDAVLSGTVSLPVPQSPEEPEFHRLPTGVDSTFTIPPGDSLALRLAVTTTPTTPEGEYSRVLELGVECGTIPISVSVVPGPDQIEIRNGTWSVTETVSFTGPDSCLLRPEVINQTADLMCNLTIVEGGQFEVLCDIDESGEDVSYKCQVRINLGLCYEIVEIEGAGTVTDSTFDIISSHYARLESVAPGDSASCELFYGAHIDACTTHVVAVGVFLSPDGDSTCAQEPGAAGISLGRLLSAASIRYASQ